MFLSSYCKFGKNDILHYSLEKKYCKDGTFFFFLLQINLSMINDNQSQWLKSRIKSNACFVRHWYHQTYSFLTFKEAKDHLLWHAWPNVDLECAYMELWAFSLSEH